MSTVNSADLIAVPFGFIPPKEVVPLWAGLGIARRHVTMVIAPGGTSKGLLTVDIIARVTTGRPFPGEPDSAVREPEAVVLVAPEDDPNEAVAWRLKAAEADTSLVFNLTVLPDGSPFILPDSVPQLRNAITQIEELAGRKVGLIVIDPLMATVEKSIASNIAARKVTAPLEKLARDMGPAVILTHHTVKSGAAAGSKGLTDAMRHVLRIARPEGADPNTPVREITVEKSNMSTTATRIRYALVGEGEGCHVYWPADEGSAAVSRGYDIEAPAAPAYTVETTTSPVVTWQVLSCAKGEKAAKLADGLSEQAAKDAAAAHAGHGLTWKAGDYGSLMSATLAKGGTPVAYTVFPNNS